MAVAAAMLHGDVHKLLTFPSEVGESPIWDARTSTLYFVNIQHREVHIYRPAGGLHKQIKVPGCVGNIALTRHQDFLLASLQRSVVEVNVSKTEQEHSVVAELPHNVAPEGETYFNDGKPSPAGVFLDGLKHYGWENGAQGGFFRLENDSRPAHFRQLRLPEYLVLPNGMVWDEQKGVFYLADTGSRTITMFEADANGVPIETGPEERLEGKIVASFSAEECEGPDGMAIDADGNLWIALTGSSKVVCIDPASGDRLHEVTVPVSAVTACTFGDEDLATLYITVKGEGEPEPLGGLYSTRIEGVRGVAGAYFCNWMPQQ